MLHNIRIASPCSVDWEKMEGDDRVRFCSACQLNVYNFSEMTEREIRRLIEDHEGRRLCGQLYRRKDGTILTRNCPVGLRAVVRRLSRVAGAILSFMTPGFAAAQTPANSQMAINTAPTVHVVNRQGKAVVNAYVTFKQKGSKQELRGETDAKGTVFFPSIPNGEYVVKVNAPGYEVYKKRLQFHSGDNLPIRVRLYDLTIHTGGVISVVPVPPAPQNQQKVVWWLPPSQ